MDKSGLPIIVESETSNLGRGGSSHTSHRGSGTFRRLPQLVIVVFAIIVVGEVIFGIKTLSTPPPSIGKIQPISGGKVILSSPILKYRVGDVATVAVRIDTGGHTINGADIVLKYDPKVLDLTDKSIKTGGVFAEFPLISVDNTQGLVRISGIASLNQPGFNGIGVLAQLSFTAKSAGNANLSIDFKPGVTTDSNLIETGSTQDIIDSVVNLNLTVQ